MNAVNFFADNIAWSPFELSFKIIQIGAGRDDTYHLNDIDIFTDDIIDEANTIAAEDIICFKRSALEFVKDAFSFIINLVDMKIDAWSIFL